MPRMWERGPGWPRDMAELAARLARASADDQSPETAPERIAADQRIAVAESLGRLGQAASDEQVSADVCLPAGVVRRRREELQAREAA